MSVLLDITAEAILFRKYHMHMDPTLHGNGNNGN